MGFLDEIKDKAGDLVDQAKDAAGDIADKAQDKLGEFTNKGEQEANAHEAVVDADSADYIEGNEPGHDTYR